MKREIRIKILNKLAKKDKKLSGRMNRKEVEKYLANSKKVFDKSTSELKAVEKMIMNLKNKYDGLKEQQTGSKDDMNFCHGLLRNMDFSNASEVRIKDQEDVAYSVDGKWCSYSDDEGLTKYEKKKKKEVEEEAEAEEEDTEKDEESEDEEDVSDADDVNDVIHKLVHVEDTDGVSEEELMEGVDVTI